MKNKYKNIISKSNEINLKIKKLKDELREIISQCDHPILHREFEHHASTGNYDPHMDSYWTTHYCMVCNETWSTDQRWPHETPNYFKIYYSEPINGPYDTGRRRHKLYPTR